MAGRRLTPALAELLNRYRRLIVRQENEVRLMEAHLAGRQEQGAFGTHSGKRDTTAESIAKTRAQITELQELVDKHDPDGFTKLV